MRHIFFKEFLSFKLHRNLSLNKVEKIYHFVRVRPWRSRFQSITPTRKKIENYNFTCKCFLVRYMFWSILRKLSLLLSEIHDVKVRKNMRNVRPWCWNCPFIPLTLKRLGGGWMPPPPKVFWPHSPDRLHDHHQKFSNCSYTFSAIFFFYGTQIGA